MKPDDQRSTRQGNDSTKQKVGEKRVPQQDVPGKEGKKEAPAGNAIYDPTQQTHRRDIPDVEQTAAGEPARGTLPPGE